MHFRGRPRPQPSFQSSFRLQSGIIYSIKGMVAAPAAAQPVLLPPLYMSDSGDLLLPVPGEMSMGRISSSVPF